MKKLFMAGMMAAVLLPVRAQLFSPEAFTGAAFGALIGGIAGGDSYYHGCHYHNDFSGQGAAIGAGIGLLAGALAGEAHRREACYAEPVSYIPAPSVSLGYGYSRGDSSAYVYYAPNNYTAPGYYYQPSRPNYAVGGSLLGAASGALIGAGNEQAGKGAAIGAAAGLLLGGIAEHAARKREQKPAPDSATVHSPSDESGTVNTPQAAKLQARVPQSEITSKPCATSSYNWTPRPQIADAPRVPDAPTF